MKKILITGGAGYIGSMLSTALVSKGYKVTVLDNFFFQNYSTLNHLFFYKNFNLINMDIRNSHKIKKIIKDFDVIIPLAGLVGAPLCSKFKKKTIETNYKAIKELINNKKNNQKIIYLNSNSGYGIGKKNTLCDENSPMNPISLYGLTKANAEKEVLKSNNFIVFRLATVFGVSYRMRPELLVNNFTYNALKYKKLSIYEPYFRRNFIHVRDVVRCILFALKNFQKLKNNVFNLGLSSANLTKIDLAKNVKKFIKETKIRVFNNKKDPDQRDYFVSNKKIEANGFKAKITLDEGIRELIDYYKLNKISKTNY